MPHEQLISNLKAALARALRISDEEVDLTCAMHAAGYTFTIYPHGMPTHAVGDDTVMLFEGGDGNAFVVACARDGRQLRITHVLGRNYWYNEITFEKGQWYADINIEYVVVSIDMINTFVQKLNAALPEGSEKVPHVNEFIERRR